MSIKHLLKARNAIDAEMRRAERRNKMFDALFLMFIGALLIAFYASTLDIDSLVGIYGSSSNLKLASEFDSSL